ncbi:MAG: hypothetical protein IT304_03460 [Dehalococcoidia bacterium]|nr:hypothetical protein [Dehalococcoidia bacterium]
MSEYVTPPGHQHPERWREDLNPAAQAGENSGPGPGDTAVAPLTAAELKTAHDVLPGFTDDELRAIPVLRAGQRFEQGATYLDLRHRGRGAFTATGDMAANDEHWYVRKDTVGYQLWDRLLGVRRP